MYGVHKSKSKLNLLLEAETLFESSLKLYSYVHQSGPFLRDLSAEVVFVSSQDYMCHFCMQV